LDDSDLVAEDELQFGAADFDAEQIHVCAGELPKSSETVEAHPSGRCQHAAP
jgi:hypothetical protein